MLAANVDGIWTVVGTGIVILLLFLVLRIFKTIFSLPFIGFVLTLYSYFVYDYYLGAVPVISCIGLVLCLTGFAKSGVVKKIFALLGILLSVYTILVSFGIL